MLKMVWEKKTVYENLLILDDMTAIADKTPNFGHFLTTSRKINLSCMFFIIFIEDLKIGAILFPKHIFILFETASNESLTSLLHDLTVGSYAYGTRKRDN